MSAEKAAKIVKLIEGNKTTDAKKALKKKGLDINSAQGAIIFAAIEKGNIELLKLILTEHHPDLTGHNRDDKASPLHRAVALRNIDAVHLLLASKAFVNAKDAEELTPLHLAVSDVSLDLVQILLSNKADVNARTWTPLHSAAERGSPEMVKLLLENGADPFRQSRGKTPLQVAQGSVKHLFPLGEKQSFSATVAPSNRPRGRVHEKFSSLLSDESLLGSISGPDAQAMAAAATAPGRTIADDMESSKPWMSLWNACNTNQIELVKQILDRGMVDFNHPGLDGSPPLWIASHHGHNSIVAALLQSPYVDVNAEHTKKSTTPLFAAASAGHFSVVKTLLDKDPELSCTDKMGATLMHAVCVNGHHQILNFFLSETKIMRSVAVNAQDADGTTALMLAAAGGHSICAMELLERGANIDVEDARHLTALDYAIKSDNADIQRAITSQASINVRNAEDALRKQEEELNELRKEVERSKKANDILGNEPIQFTVEDLETKKRQTIQCPQSVTISELKKVIAKEFFKKSALKMDLSYKGDPFEPDMLMDIDDVDDWRDFVIFSQKQVIFVKKKM